MRCSKLLPIFDFYQSPEQIFLLGLQGDLKWTTWYRTFGDDPKENVIRVQEIIRAIAITHSFTQSVKESAKAVISISAQENEKNIYATYLAMSILQRINYFKSLDGEVTDDIVKHRMADQFEEDINFVITAGLFIYYYLQRIYRVQAPTADIVSCITVLSKLVAPTDEKIVLPANMKPFERTLNEFLRLCNQLQLAIGNEKSNMFTTVIQAVIKHELTITPHCKKIQFLSNLRDKVNNPIYSNTKKTIKFWDDAKPAEGISKLRTILDKLPVIRKIFIDSDHSSSQNEVKSSSAANSQAKSTDEKSNQTTMIHSLNQIKEMCKEVENILNEKNNEKNIFRSQIVSDFYENTLNEMQTVNVLEPGSFTLSVSSRLTPI